jgi:endonuclease G
VRLLVRILAGLWLGSALAASAASTGCPEHYPAGQAPGFINPRLATETREICYSEFGLMHSGVTRTPLWSAEHITAAEVAQAETIRRKNAFHADPHLPRKERAELRDYAKSGFDRGHMTPSGDMPTEQAQYESFSLANMIPQNPRNNQRLWARIESAVRTLVKKEGELYLMTGPLFLGAQLEQIGGRVLVPSHIYKIVYDPRRQRAAAYLVENRATDDYRVVTVTELERLAGIDFLPWLAAEAKAQPLKLPLPSQR